MIIIISRSSIDENSTSVHVFSVSGDFHNWIHVIRELETVSEEDKKESQNYEWKGKSHLQTFIDNL